MGSLVVCYRRGLVLQLIQGEGQSLPHLLREQLRLLMGCSTAEAQHLWFGWQITSPKLFITEVSKTFTERSLKT